MYKVIDNFLHQNDFVKLQSFFTSIDCHWYYSKGVAKTDVKEGKYFYMIHTVYQDHMPTSNIFNNCYPVLEKLGVKSLLRIKANLYPNQGESVHTHDAHQDYLFSHKAAVYSMNTCNGGTVIGGEFIESKANRIVIFDGSIPHSSTTCTDEQVRINIGFNYGSEECLK